MWPARHLPTALRTFLLTLAVVDDLLAITVIAIFYTDHLSLGALALAVIPIGLFGLAVQRGIHHWWLLLPLAAAAWALVHASGGVWGGCVYDTEKIVERLEEDRPR